MGSMVFCTTPQRTHSSRARSMPAAAAETGSSVLEKSIQAHTFAACVTRERKESAIEVRPEHSGPTNSLIAPTGSPPFKTSSSDSMPVAATGRIIFGAGVRAEGIFSARADSIWSRIAEAVGMANSLRLIFAYLQE